MAGSAEMLRRPAASFGVGWTWGRIKQVVQGWPPPGVSAREAEVLEGVAEHLTNAEIGGRLFISIRTVREPRFLPAAQARSA